MNCRQKVYKKNGEDIFFGMCHAGIEEYVFFVNSSSFVSVSGYGINKEKAFERMRALSQKYCLNFEELSVTEIALVCGFDNSNYFSTAFKRICGVTPSEYRRKS